MSLCEKLLSFPPDKRIDHYAFSLKAILGTGSYSKVYLGTNENTKVPVAIKVIDKKTLKNQYAWK